jgi:hypothetical protein
MIKEDDMGGTLEQMGEKRNAYRLLGKPEGKETTRKTKT